jgi:hypothetical protein
MSPLPPARLALAAGLLLLPGLAGAHSDAPGLNEIHQEVKVTWAEVCYRNATLPFPGPLGQGIRTSVREPTHGQALDFLPLPMPSPGQRCSHVAPYEVIWSHTECVPMEGPLILRFGHRLFSGGALVNADPSGPLLASGFGTTAYTVAWTINQPGAPDPSPNPVLGEAEVVVEVTIAGTGGVCGDPPPPGNASVLG